MYRVGFSQQRALKSNIGFLIASLVEDEKELRITSVELLRALMNITVRVLNDKEEDLEIYDKFLRIFNEYENRRLMFECCDFFYNFICEVKKELLIKGDDDRLRYRLKEFPVSDFDIAYEISMDLEYTYSEDFIKKVEKEEVKYAELIDENPSIDRINDFLNMTYSDD